MELQLQIEQAREYWLSKFSELEAAGVVFTGGKLDNRPAKIYHCQLSPELTLKIDKVSRKDPAAIFLVMLAGLYVTGRCYMSQEMLIVSTSSCILEEEPGNMNDLCLLKLIAAPDSNLSDLLTMCKEELYSALDFKVENMQEVLDQITRQHAADALKIWNIGLVLDAFNHQANITGVSNIFRVYRGDEGFHIEVSGHSSHTDRFMHGFLDQWMFILEKMLSDPGETLNNLIALRPEETAYLLAMAHADTVQPAFDNIPDFIIKQLRMYPHKVAIVYEEKHLTNEELDRYSDNVACWLREDHAVKAGDRVGVLMKRSEWMPVILLGILRSGACYVPIDPDYPVQRVNYILNDSRPVLVIAGEQEIAGRQPLSCKVQSLEALKDIICARTPSAGTSHIMPDSLAYIIYTSGSTGDPKGVMITHYNAAVFIEWALQEFAGTSFEITFAGTSYCFDLSVFELFFTLAAGKTVRVLDSSLQIPDYLQQDDKILLNTVPSVIVELLHADVAFDTVVAVNMAGEPLPLFIKEQLDCDRLEVRNLYGPSEDTTYTTVYRLRSSDKNISIGRPVANTDIYMLDDHGRLLPHGVVGEICISGDGLADGYLFREALTKEKFVQNPFYPGKRMYRTGDLGRWEEDGNITYMGRKDHQVKIRGYRIELGEVEAALSKCESVKVALVIACKDEEGKQFLAAYVTGEDLLESSLLRMQLSAMLPEFMIPATIIVLQRFPLTPNGKIDRKALPDPLQLNGQDKTFAPPATPQEHALLEIWQDVLKKKTIGVLDNFFAIGGDSLKATRLVYQVYKRLHLDVTIKHVFDHPTIRTLASLLRNMEKKEYVPIIRVAETALYELSPSQKAIWIEDYLNDGQLSSFNIPRAVFVDDIDPVIFAQAFRMVVERHDTLRTNIVIVDGEPWQQVCPVDACTNQLHFEDLRHDIPEKDAYLQMIAKEAAMRPFRLDSEPLITAALWQVTDRRFLFLMNIHHIISDGWSLEILMSELLGNYSLLKEKGMVRRKPLPIQYRDYIAWLYEHISLDRMGRHMEYWMNCFRELPPPLNFLSDIARGDRRLYRGRTVAILIDKPTTIRIHQLALKNGASLFMTLLSVMKALLFRYTGREDMVIGTPVAGRDHPDTEELIGLFVHNVLIRTKFSGNESFLDLLRNVKGSIMDAFEHQVCPVEQILEGLNIERKVNQNPLYDVMVVLQNADIPLQQEPAEQRVEMQSYSVGADVSQVDLLVNFTEEAVGIRAEFQYDADLFRAEWMEAFVRHFENLLQAVIADPSLSLYAIPVLTRDEQQTIAAFEKEAVAANSYRVADRYMQLLPLAVRGNLYTRSAEGEQWEFTGEQAYWKPDGTLVNLGKGGDGMELALKKAAPAKLKTVNDTLDTEDEVVQILQQMWKEVLKHDGFGTNDNFFLIGGHSLKAFRMLSLVERQFKIKLKLMDVFMAPTIRQLAILIRQHGKSSLADVIAPVEEQSRYMADNRQMKIYTRIQFARSSRPYNVTGSFTLQHIDAGLFAATVRELMRRHEALRTSFVFEDGNLYQVVHDAAEPLPVTYLDFVNMENRNALLDELFAEYRDHPFDLHRPYLWKIALVRMNEALYTIVLSVQHAIGDGGSLQILSDDFNTIYEQLERGVHIRQEKGRIQLKDYCAWQNKRLQEEGDVLASYWQQRLHPYTNGHTGYRKEMETTMDQHFIPLTTVQKDFIFGKVSTARPFTGSMYTSLLPAADWQTLTTLAASLNSGYFNVLTAALFAWLARFTNEQQLVIGAPVSYRRREELVGMMGYLVEIMLIPVTITPGITFGELVNKTRAVAQESGDHLYPFEQLLDKLDLPLSAIGKVLLHLRNLDLTTNNEFPAEKIGQHTSNAAPQFELNMKCDLFRNGLVINCEYWPEKYDSSYIQAFTEGYIALLQQLVHHPDTVIIPLI